jgi:hypothetical protein
MYVTALLLQYATAVPLVPELVFLDLTTTVNLVAHSLLSFATLSQRFANAADVSLTLELGPLVGQIFVMIIYDKSQYIKIL